MPPTNCTLVSSADILAADDAMMPLTAGVVDFYIQHYIFPVQFFLGVFGNSINLVVLLSSGMKNQANILLSAMAFADLAFLFCMLPHSLGSFSIFYKSIRFVYFYHLSKIHCVALANWFSTAATFLVLAVSLERFSGVRHPMHTRFQLRDQRLLLLILSIYSTAFLLTFFHHLDYRVLIRIDCARVITRYTHMRDLNNTSPLLTGYVHIAKYAQSVFGVFLPVIAVAVLNVSLVYFLRKRQLLPRASNGSGSSKGQQEQEFRYSDIGTFQRRERKVTATVIAIVTCFTVTHLPSLVPVVWDPFLDRRDLHLAMSALLNCVVVTGKVLNFFLFCTSSAHFRRRAVLILKAYICHGRSRKKYSSMAMSNMANTQTNVTSVMSNHCHGGGTALPQTSARTARLHNGHAAVNGVAAGTAGTYPLPNHQTPITAGGTTTSYRVPKQSTLSLRESLLRQSGAEFDEEEEAAGAITMKSNRGGGNRGRRTASGSQSERPVMFN